MRVWLIKLRKLRRLLISRLGALQTVTYTLKVIVSKKWREIEYTLLLYTTNRKYHIAYLFVPFPMTLENTEGHSLYAGLISAIRRTFVRHMHSFN